MCKVPSANLLPSLCMCACVLLIFPDQLTLSMSTAVLAPSDFCPTASPCPASTEQGLRADLGHSRVQWFGGQRLESDSHANFTPATGPWMRDLDKLFLLECFYCGLAAPSSSFLHVSTPPRVTLLPLLRDQQKVLIWIHSPHPRQRNPIQWHTPSARPSCPDPQEPPVRAVRAHRGRSPGTPAPQHQATLHSDCPAHSCLPTELWPQGQGTYILHVPAPSTQHQSNSAHCQCSQKCGPWSQPAWVPIQTLPLFAV